MYIYIYISFPISRNSYLPTYTQLIAILSHPSRASSKCHGWHDTAGNVKPIAVPSICRCAAIAIIIFKTLFSSRSPLLLKIAVPPPPVQKIFCGTANPATRARGQDRQVILPLIEWILNHRVQSLGKFQNTHKQNTDTHTSVYYKRHR